ncbi:hypothetical protein K443DRAFT_681685 [Laccaria amethystina LaAM-08-1]|jgi:hypothetical protein|uniref:Uncharacterized protein n=1 Tax=Laccaria amethystina LaAM-08-1 TaxID=1095629 RepID=A0A0C9XM78_9AGAR|nr:hypothetical protein K443DRAFT_681685 [Laccaria amethystina LaAM-08-1]
MLSFWQLLKRSNFEAVGLGEALEGVDRVNVMPDEYLEGIGHGQRRTFELAIS